MEQRSAEDQNNAKSPASRPPETPRGPKPGMLTEAQYRDRIRRRFFRTLDYGSIALSMLIIYGSILICDYSLLWLIGYLFQAEMEDSSYLAMLLKGIRVGLAVLTFVLATIHGMRSCIEQYKLDARLAREDEKPHV